jgi:hypothetical protein
VTAAQAPITLAERTSPERSTTPQDCCFPPTVRFRVVAALSTIDRDGDRHAGTVGKHGNGNGSSADTRLKSGPRHARIAPQARPVGKGEHLWKLLAPRGHQADGHDARRCRPHRGKRLKARDTAQQTRSANALSLTPARASSAVEANCCWGKYYGKK